MISTNSAPVSSRTRYSELGESTLVTLAQKGDKDAMGELYARTFPQLCKTLRNRGLKADQAEDIAATTLLRAVESIQKLTDTKNTECFSKWTYTIARRIQIDMSRRAGFRRDVSLEFLLEVSFREPPVITSGVAEASIHHVENELVLAQIKVLLMGVMNTLTEQQRHIFELRYVHELSQREVAERLGITIGAVKTCTYRMTERIKRDPMLGRLYHHLQD